MSMIDEKEKYFFYELVIFLSSNLTDKEAEEKFNNFVKQIEEADGTIMETNLPHLELLAYPIKKETSGYFCVVRFEIEEGKIEELEKKLSLSPDILRFSIFRKQKLTQKPTRRKIFRAVSSKTEEIKEKSVPKETGEVSLEELEQKLNEILKE